MKKQLCSYDIWGNEKDGYQVNNVFAEDIYIEVTDKTSDKDIIQQAKKKGFLNKHIKDSSFDIEGEDDFTLYVTYTPKCMPIFELRNID